MDLMRCLVLALFVCTACPAAHADSRLWTDRQGRSFEGELVEQTRDHVLVRRDQDGKEGWIAIARLSDSDRDYVANRAIYRRLFEDVTTDTSTTYADYFWRTDLEATLASLAPGKSCMVLYRHRFAEGDFVRFLNEVINDPTVQETFAERMPLVVVGTRSSYLEDRLGPALLKNLEGPVMVGLCPAVTYNPVRLRWPLTDVIAVHQGDALGGREAFLHRLEPVLLRLEADVRAQLAEDPMEASAARATDTPEAPARDSSAALSVPDTEVARADGDGADNGTGPSRPMRDFN